MHCDLFTADPAVLISALVEDAMLTRYRQALADELPSLADRGMAAHLRRMDVLAMRVLTGGWDALVTLDSAAADALLTDVFAVARWQGWSLPVTAMTSADVDVAAIARGLLKADRDREGAGLWILPDGRIAFARTRIADPAGAEMPGHGG